MSLLKLVLGNCDRFSHSTCPFPLDFVRKTSLRILFYFVQSPKELVSHIFDKRWREVFLLAVAMSPNAEKLVLLMKEKIDGLLAEDRGLQKYLEWLNEKTTEVDVQYQLEDAQVIQKEFKFYANIDRTISRFFYFGLDSFFNRNLNRNRNLAQELDYELYEVLLKLKERLPDEKNTNEAEFKEWWKNNGKAWSEDFRNAIIEHQNIGHDWQLSEEQKTLLEQYYRANQFLTECLHHECYVSPEVRRKIEETLLLPLAEIEKRQNLKDIQD